MVLFFMKKKENYLKALNNLVKSFEKFYPPKEQFFITGLIAHYDICFEQSWKALREELIENGISRDKLNSPRFVIKHAFYEQLINNEEAWLKMLKARNESTHIYDDELAKNLINIIKEEFLPELIDLGKVLEKI